jgi:hypothetical protein
LVTLILGQSVVLESLVQLDHQVTDGSDLAQVDGGALRCVDAGAVVFFAIRDSEKDSGWGSRRPRFWHNQSWMATLLIISSTGWW